MFNKKLLSFLLPLTIAGGMASSCTTSEPKVTEFLNTADSATEISKMDENLKNSKSQQVNLLAPVNYKLAVDSLNEAKASRKANAEQSIVLHKIALSQAYLNKADRLAGVARQLLTGVMDSRKEALSVNANSYYPKEFSVVDTDLEVITKQIENDDHSNVEKSYSGFVSRYKDLKENSIKLANLSPEKKKLQQVLAENEKLKSVNTQFQDNKMFEEKFEHARHQFSPSEAEVYKQGNNLLIRLKGLSFTSGQSVITEKYYPILGKVQNVIKDFGSAKVLVQGHTDSVGSKTLNQELSAKRANAVEAYLVSNNTVPTNNIEAKGFGDSQPISSNKTSVGRAENRRIDVVISPVATTANEDESTTTATPPTDAPPTDAPPTETPPSPEQD